MHMHQSCDDIWGRCQQRGGEHMDLGQARSCRGRRKPRRGGGGGGDGAKGCRSPSTFQAPGHCQGPGVTGASCCMLRPQGFVRLCALLRMTKWSAQHKASGQAANSAVCLWDVWQRNAPCMQPGTFMASLAAATQLAVSVHTSEGGLTRKLGCHLWLPLTVLQRRFDWEEGHLGTVEPLCEESGAWILWVAVALSSSLGF